MEWHQGEGGRLLDGWQDYSMRGLWLDQDSSLPEPPGCRGWAVYDGGQNGLGWGAKLVPSGRQEVGKGRGVHRHIFPPALSLPPSAPKGLPAPNVVLPAHNYNSMMEVKGFIFYFFVLCRH